MAESLNGKTVAQVPDVGALLALRAQSRPLTAEQDAQLHDGLLAKKLARLPMSPDEDACLSALAWQRTAAAAQGEAILNLRRQMRGTTS